MRPRLAARFEPVTPSLTEIAVETECVPEALPAERLEPPVEVESPEPSPEPRGEAQAQLPVQAVPRPVAETKAMPVTPAPPDLPAPQVAARALAPVPTAPVVAKSEPNSASSPPAAHPEPTAPAQITPAVPALRAPPVAARVPVPVPAALLVAKPEPNSAPSSPAVRPEPTAPAPIPPAPSRASRDDAPSRIAPAPRQIAALETTRAAMSEPVHSQPPAPPPMPRALRTVRAPQIQREAPPPVETTIHVSIGRIEVRAPPPAAARPREPAASPVMTLADYLQKRTGRVRS